MKRFGLLFLLCCWQLILSAQTENDSLDTRYITRVTSYGVGFTNLLDTYLSPSEYTGEEIRFMRENMRMTKLMNGKVSSQVIYQSHVAYTNNDADSGNEISALFSYSYGLHYHYRLAPRFKILIGPYGQANTGFIYNTRNSNNPAQAKAYLNLGASGMAIYQLRIGKYETLLRYQANLPLAGVMFSPDYQQSYYEIFTQGNWNHVIQFTSLHNQPSLHQMLTFDFPVKSSTLRFSYILDLHQSKINQIKCHTYSHSFMLGFVKNICTVRSKQQLNHTPLYY